MTFDYAPLANSPLEHLRGAAVVIMVMAAVAAAMTYHGIQGATPQNALGSSAMTRLPPIEAPPLLLRDVAPEDALTINREIPFAGGPNPAARPFKANGDDTSYARALECLATAIYYEAGSESPDGQRAVAQVVLNRVRHPAFVPSVCGVVYHGSTRVTGCQFSFTCDGSLLRPPTQSGWKEAREIALQALGGAVFKPVGYATHYHANYVVPYWATSLAKNAVVGRHIFYRWPEWWGTPGAFARRHAGSEPDPRLLLEVALHRPHVRQASLIASDLVLETDPRVELMGIVQFLAAGSPLTEQSSDYEEEVLLHFSRNSEDVAVQIYRQLSEDGKFDAEAFLKVVVQASEPARRGKVDAELIKAVGGRAKLQGFASALRDFVKHSEFEKFYGEHKAFYAELAANARKPAIALLVNVERETDIPVHTAKFILAPLLANAALSTCHPVPNKDPEGWLIVGVRDGLEEPFDKEEPFKARFAKLSKSDCSSQFSYPMIAAR